MRPILKGVVTQEGGIVVSDDMDRPSAYGRGLVELTSAVAGGLQAWAVGIGCTDVSGWRHEGVESVARSLSAAFEIAMCQAVTTTTKQITRDYIVHFGAAANRR
jgi:hypothetical protein